MWQKPVKKTVYTVNVDNYAPEVTSITYPYMRAYCDKIGADFHIIDTRKWPERAPVYEKLQIYELGQQHENDWNIFIDSDALIHPDMFDVTEHLSKDTVCHHGSDMANHRWKYDRIFRRDGRHIGSCNWFTIASDWCIELWKPPVDQTYEEACANIYPTLNELRSGVIPGGHLIDDYTLSRNIATYGFKFTTVVQLCKEMEIGLAPGNPGYFWHQYTIPVEQKPIEMQKVLRAWGLS